MGGRSIPRCTSCGYKHYDPPAATCRLQAWHSKDADDLVAAKHRRDYAKQRTVVISVSVTGEQAAALHLQAQTNAISLGGLVATIVTKHLERSR